MSHITPASLPAPAPSLNTGKSGGSQGLFYLTIQDKPKLPLPLYVIFPSFFGCSSLFDGYFPGATSFSH